MNKTIILLLVSAVVTYAAAPYDLTGVPAHLRNQPVQKIVAEVTSVRGSNLVVKAQGIARVPATSTSYARVGGRMTPINNTQIRAIPTNAVYVVKNYPGWTNAAVGDKVSFALIAGPPVAGVRDAYYLRPPPSSKTLR